MPPATLPSRSKLGLARQLKFLSPRARKLLSILFAVGIFFFALLSLSIYVKDPESVRIKKPANVGTRQRRSLHSGQHSVSRDAVQADPGDGPKRAPLRLLLATHNRLLWYHVDNDTSQVLHEGEGVHYGVFPGDVGVHGELKTLWTVIRPHNWHPKTSKEHLVQLDADTGHEISRVRIHSRFTHDAVRRGNRVFLANTEGGEVQELEYPTMKLLRSMRLFTLKQHVNTLAPMEDGSVWAVLHNLGQSDAVRIDPTADPRPRVVETIRSVGLKAHGLVAWPPPSPGAAAAPPSFVVLDSEHGAVVVVDRASGEVTRKWQAPSSEDPPKFLKGLCVVDDVAYFGVNVWGERASRDSTANNAELAAVDLKTGSLLWRRRVPTHGLLNIVAAPQLGEESTYRAMASLGGSGSGAGGAAHAATATATSSTAAAVSGDDEGTGQHLVKHQRHVGGAGGAADGVAGADGSGTGAGGSGGGGGGGHAEAKSGIDDERVRAATRQLVALGYKPKIGGHWASGQPRLDLATKDSKHSWDAGISLPLMQLNIDKLKERVLGMPDDMWTPARQRRENAAVDGRGDNMSKFKPGVEALYMVFSDQSTEHVYRFPYYDYFKDVVEPLLEQILGREDMRNVVRLQFARMKPGSTIKPHQDMGGYARFAHRIHLPVVSNDDISFLVCPEAERRSVQPRRMASADVNSSRDCVQIPMAEGMVFELNNRVMHRVFNKGDIRRVQLVVDVAEKPRQPRRLKPGTICNYKQAVMVCPPENTLPDY